MLRRTSILVYADTSVYGGVFDDEFQDNSRRFFQQVEAGRFDLLISDVVRQEIAEAPKRVQTHFRRQLAHARSVSIDEEVLTLRDAYLEHGVVSAKWAGDAAHVAAATVGGAELIVSWNFQHIVHFERIRLYNAVNALCGYSPIDVRSPAEVIGDEEDDKV
jgi:predicted nucleic acid-binding protein